jgi:hypothetical protein
MGLLVFSKRKEHGAKSKQRDFFLHVFFTISIHSSPFSFDYFIRVSRQGQSSILERSLKLLI